MALRILNILYSSKKYMEYIALQNDAKHAHQMWRISLRVRLKGSSRADANDHKCNARQGQEPGGGCQAPGESRNRQFTTLREVAHRYLLYHKIALADTQHLYEYQQILCTNFAGLVADCWLCGTLVLRLTCQQAQRLVTIYELAYTHMSVQAADFLPGGT